MKYISDLDAVLQAMIDEINDFHQRKRIALDHRLRAVQSCLDYLETEGEFYGVVNK